MRVRPFGGIPPSPSPSAKSRKHWVWSNDEAQIFEFKDFTGKILRAKQLEGNLRNRNPQGLKPLVILEAGGTAEAVPSQSSWGRGRLLRI